jgi:hypothetical protein
VAATAKYSKETCGAPVVDRTRIGSYAGVIGSSLAVLAFILRICARFRGVSGSFGLDDLALGATMVRLIESYYLTGSQSLTNSAPQRPFHRIRRPP